MYTFTKLTENEIQNYSLLTPIEIDSLGEGDFGLPEERRYPLVNTKYIRMAINKFSLCEKKNKEELANNIAIAALERGINLPEEIQQYVTVEIDGEIAIYDNIKTEVDIDKEYIELAAKVNNYREDMSEVNAKRIIEKLSNIFDYNICDKNMLPTFIKSEVEGNTFKLPNGFFGVFITNSRILLDEKLFTDPFVELTSMEITAFLIHAMATGTLMMPEFLPKYEDKVRGYMGKILYSDGKYKEPRFDRHSNVTRLTIEQRLLNMFKFNYVEGESDLFRFMSKIGLADHHNRVIAKLLANNVISHEDTCIKTDEAIDRDIDELIRFTVSRLKYLYDPSKREMAAIRAHLSSMREFATSMCEYNAIELILFRMPDRFDDWTNNGIHAPANALSESEQVRLKEAFSIGPISFRSNKPIGRVLDELELDIRDIQDIDDKRKLLGRLYGLKERCKKERRGEFIAQIEDLILVVKRVEIKSKKYGVFIEYPKGFEG